jgi:type IV pilus assembly protein PilW
MESSARSDIGTRGFTLIEILVVLVLTGIVMTIVYFMFLTQDKNFNVQEQVSAMQQNLRAAMDLMEKEIRVAGYDPTGKAKPAINIDDGFEFQWDRNKDGDITTPGDEQIHYKLKGDGDLGRDTGAGLQTVAENIDALDFVYLDEDNSPTDDVRDIRSVQVTLVAKTDKPDIDYTDQRVYRNLQDEVVLGAPNDSHRRQILTAQIKCRNLGMD